jgi:hypothetical protein
MNQDLKRVGKRIGDAIVEYTDTHKTFRMEYLRQFVEAKVGKVAPGSPDRILRQLRADGTLNYQVISRHDSLYQMV